MLLKILTTLPLLIFSAISLLGQNISQLKLNNKLSILNDRAFFQFPADAKNVARQGDIMSTDPNTNNETRIILDIDKQRLVFFARELFVTSKNDLLSTISKEDGSNIKSKILTNTDSLLSVLSTPSKFDSTKNAILINNLYVKTQDNSVFVIGAYINPDAFQNIKEYQELSQKVFATLTKGNRKLNFKARTESFPIFDGKKKFSISLPQNYIVTKDKKYDFEVLKFRKMQDMSDSGWLSLTIYTGNHPSYFYNDYDFNSDQAEMVKSNFLGQPVEWLYFKNEENQLYLKEQQIPCDNIEKGLIVHIAMSGSSQKSIEELTELIKNIKLAN